MAGLMDDLRNASAEELVDAALRWASQITVEPNTPHAYDWETKQELKSFL